MASNGNMVNPDPTFVDRVLRFCLAHKVLVFFFFAAVVLWGIIVAPFDWEIKGLARDPVPVDAIPDIGEKQQIVFTEWMGRSPHDVDQQITYPLTVALLGIPDVKTIRSYSMFGFSMVYIIFDEKAEFYWTRSRVLEKLSSLPTGILPEGVQPTLGPDATALGQVFWYTLEGQDKDGRDVGGWDLAELRTLQDWTVRYGLMSAEGVAEVASVGGFVQEYQVDVDPNAMRAADVMFMDVLTAVKMANLDVGAEVTEINKVEYMIRGIGFVKKVSDLENAVIKVKDNVPIYVKNIAHVSLGPALRRGALDKGGNEAVGGVVVVRYGSNPLQVIKNVKAKIAEMSPGLPSKTLPDGTVSHVTIVPFYDRTGLIYETLGTLNQAILEQILITIIVILFMLVNIGSSLMISALLPIAVLMCFIGMKLAGVDSNIVSLSGIAIAIGTMVDMGIIISENIVRHVEAASPEEDRLEVVYRASSEVGSAVLTAISTTVVSFLPVFTMQAAEGKLFKPLAYTKTFALAASVIVALTLLPAVAHLLLNAKVRSMVMRFLWGALIAAGGGVALAYSLPWVGVILIAIAAFIAAKPFLPRFVVKSVNIVATAVGIAVVLYFLAHDWMPLGPEVGFYKNAAFVAIITFTFLLFYLLIQVSYRHVLAWCLENKLIFLTAPLFILLLGVWSWLGFDKTMKWLPDSWRQSSPYVYLAHTFPALGHEFMPPLDEGSFLFMPSTMPHASIGEAMNVLQMQDRAIKAIPEVETVVGKLGRVESALDPAPVSMFETVISYLPEFVVDKSGYRQSFKFDPGRNDLFRNAKGEPVFAPDGIAYYVEGAFERDSAGNLIPDPDGKPFRNWRPALDLDLNKGRDKWGGINTPDDIWREITSAATVPGVTSAPKLQPIATRIVMLQSGMRAPMGIKVYGPDLETIEKFSFQIENSLRQVPSIEASSVYTERGLGAPYIEIVPDREAAARYGVMIGEVNDIIEAAIGGMKATTAIEGRERFSVRVRYMRELRGTLEDLAKILIPTRMGAQIPLSQLAKINFTRGPMMLKSENTFLVGYVLFDRHPEYAEVDVVEAADGYLKTQIQSGALVVPKGVRYAFAGNYENSIRSEKRLSLILPIALFLIFLILYLQFSDMPVTLIVFSGIAFAWAGGFLLLWLYGQPWFMDFSLMGANLRELFSMHTINLSVAVWVGFLALFGVATDDGVVMATYIQQSFQRNHPTDTAGVRAAVLEAGVRRVRPCLMTTATTVLALLPVLSSTGRGSDIMVPMAIPSFGGMMLVVVTMYVVPVLYSAYEETKVTLRRRQEPIPPEVEPENPGVSSTKDTK